MGQHLSSTPSGRPHKPGGTRTTPGRKLFGLTVGNSTYHPVATNLPRAKHDATDMAALLRSHGFDVTLVIDGTKQDMVRAFEALLLKVQAAAGMDVTVVLHFSGHGFDVDRGPQRPPQTYFVPTPGPGAPGRASDCVLLTTALRSLNKVMHKGRLFAFVDCCRMEVDAALLAGPGMPELADSNGNGSPGIEGRDFQSSTVSIFLSFASVPGKPSFEDPRQTHSYYTGALLEQLWTYGSDKDIRVLTDCAGAVVSAHQRMGTPHKLLLGCPLPEDETVVLLPVVTDSTGKGKNTNTVPPSPVEEPTLAGLTPAHVRPFLAQLKERLGNADAQLAGLQQLRVLLQAALDAAGASGARPVLPCFFPHGPCVTWVMGVLKDHAHNNRVAVAALDLLMDLSQLRPAGRHLRPELATLLDVAGNFPPDCSDVWFPVLATVANVCVMSTEEGCSASIIPILPELERVLQDACTIGNALSVVACAWSVAGLAEKCTANHMDLVPLLPALRAALQRDPEFREEHLPAGMVRRSDLKGSLPGRCSLTAEALLRALGSMAATAEAQVALLELLPAAHGAFKSYPHEEGVVELVLELLSNLSTGQANHKALLPYVPIVEAILTRPTIRSARPSNALRLHQGPQTLVTRGVQFMFRLMHGVDSDPGGVGTAAATAPVLRMAAPRPPPVPVLTLAHLNDRVCLRTALEDAVVRLLDHRDNATSYDIFVKWVPRMMRALA